MEILTLVICALVYIGLFFGSLPGIAADRTGMALLGAIALIVVLKLSTRELFQAVDISVIATLFGLMIIAAHFYFCGFFSIVVENLRAPPARLLLLVILITAALSALLLNDVVCLALAPLVIHLCHRQTLNPLPFLLGLCCASNVGSALTLIGNPQNILIGEAFDLSFIRYAIIAFVPTVLGLFVIWVVLLVQYRGKWNAPSQSDLLDLPEPDRWQIWKGMAILAVVIVLFLFSEEARPLIALGGAGVLLLSRKMASKTMLNFIDWQLLVLFMSLFIINDRLLSTQFFQFDFSPDKPELFLVTAGLSFFISNVPAVMLLLPFSDDGPLLALASTFAGNMLVISSLANIIVIGQAQKMGVRISWGAHFKTGAIVTLLTLLIAAGWLFLV